MQSIPASDVMVIVGRPIDRVLWSVETKISFSTRTGLLAQKGYWSFMPIQIRPLKSLAEVQNKIKTYEERYRISSSTFASDTTCRAAVPEFDAIEWNFLLMQQTAMREDDACGGPAVIWSNYQTKTAQADQRIYEDLAA
jgi:hypothetical protein